MVREITDGRLNPVSQFLLAGTAGAVARVSVNGLGNTKIMGCVGTPGGMTGSVMGLMWVWDTEGMKGMLRGAKLSALKAFPHYGIMFSTYSQLAPAWEQNRLANGMPTATSLMGTFFAGSISGLAATLVTHPLDVARARYAVAPYAGTTQIYRAELDTLFQILEREGLYRGIYRGLGISLIGSAIFGGYLFTMADFACNIPWVYHRENASFFRGISPSLEPMMWLAWAATVATMASHPIDVLRLKHMAYSPLLPNNSGVNIKSNNLMECAAQIWRQFGIAGFFQGAASNIVRSFPQVVIFTLMYKGGKMLLGGPVMEKH
jgi:hypothetical protein